MKLGKTTAASGGPISLRAQRNGGKKCAQGGIPVTPLRSGESKGGTRVAAVLILMAGAPGCSLPLCCACGNSSKAPPGGSTTVTDGRAAAWFGVSSASGVPLSGSDMRGQQPYLSAIAATYVLPLGSPLLPAPFSFLHRARRVLSFRASTEKKEWGALPRTRWEAC